MALKTKLNTVKGSARKGQRYREVVKNGERYHSYAGKNGKPGLAVKLGRPIRKLNAKPLVENRKDATVTTEINKGTVAGQRKGSTFKQVFVGPKGQTPAEYHVYGGKGTGRKRKVLKVPK